MRQARMLEQEDNLIADALAHAPRAQAQTPASAPPPVVASHRGPGALVAPRQELPSPAQPQPEAITANMAEDAPLITEEDPGLVQWADNVMQEVRQDIDHARHLGAFSNILVKTSRQQSPATSIGQSSPKELEGAQAPGQGCQSPLPTRHSLTPTPPDLPAAAPEPGVRCRGSPCVLLLDWRHEKNSVNRFSRMAQHVGFLPHRLSTHS